MAILGIDEVGRGPWAGPLVIGAVVLEDPEDLLWEDLDDSKKLSIAERERLAEIIEENAIAYGLGWVPAEDIDKLSLGDALRFATRQAIRDIPKEKYSEIIIDGTINFLQGTPQENLVTILPKADGKIKAVSAASIIAKVARDHYMYDVAKKYPGYGFETHVGYGTAKHKAALKKLGPCPEHRRSVKPVAAETNSIKPRSPRVYKNTTAIGKKAEDVVAKYLEEQGHKVMARNHRTRFYEIDIISATKDHIYFTEVKYRKNSKHGAPLDFVNRKKQRQMKFAAEAFMKYLSKRLDRPESSLPSPILAAAAVSGENYTLDQWFPLDS